jgi:hypothetical protein
MYHDGPEIMVNLILNDATSHIVKTHTDDLGIETEDLSLVMDEECALVTPEGVCYEGEVLVEYTYINSDQVEKTSIPMQALSNGEIKHLISNGMALVDFYAADSTVLIYNNTRSKICYHVGQEQIDAWDSRLKW